MNSAVYTVIRLTFLLITALIHSGWISAQEYRRWEMMADGSIRWTINSDIPHADHLEMSGKYISAVVRYQVNTDKTFLASRSLVWPMLRTIPNNTHASLTRRFSVDGFQHVLVNGKPLQETSVDMITLNGTLATLSRGANDLRLTRRFFPSTEWPAYYEIYGIKNLSTKPIRIEVPDLSAVYRTDSAEGVDGSYEVRMDYKGQGVYKLGPLDSMSFAVVYSARKEGAPRLDMDASHELQLRMDLIAMLGDNLVLATPDTVLNTAFAFAKIRATESIFQTKGGPMHGPGGEAYYAAIWANDQAEYVGPFFPYLGYPYGNAASLNAYMHFARFMNDAYSPIPSSIIAEGTNIWNGAGDRGDAAMIAYGAGRYALSSGDLEQAKQLWPLITWCLEYCRRQMNSEGVITSDSDELEGRLPSGDANLCTSSLYYDALISATYLGTDLGIEKNVVNKYAKEAKTLRKAIEDYFGADIAGFHTYRYYAGNDTLRAWICIPLTMGIQDRSKGTVDALFSPQLWTPDGLASIAGDDIFWDRSTLYGLRGVLASGETERGLEKLHAYSVRRLLGDHVPYPVEAYPEGSQRHLSAESGLYCRVFTEGLFGIRPVGLRSMELTPHLPASWPSMSLRHIRSFGHDFDITVRRSANQITISIEEGGVVLLNQAISDGEAIRFTFKS